ncbi:toxin [Niallia taxi]|uniref:anthrax toxin lethal factor-related metalloendopeptidase n=1 Tax=Niallia TaxID=2837506 RepID=UPI00203F0FB4|nr:toxin [Niallia sp. MER 6]MCM3030588.1 toxin [Niallia sp. MER 6]
MKHIRRFMPFFMIGIVSFLMGNSQQDIDGIFLKDFPVQSIIKGELTQSEQMNLQNIILLPKPAFDQKEAAAIAKRINRLPQSLLQKIEKKGIKVKLFTGKLTDNPTAQQFAGIVPRGYRSEKTWDDVPGIGGGQTVLVKIGASPKGSGHGSVNLEFHELAHSIDYKVLNYYSKTEAFTAAWNKEKATLFPYSQYFLNYPEEYFAETFAMYYLGGSTKETLKELAPLTYKQIASIN